MKLFKLISTAALVLFLGTTASVYAKKGQKEKGGEKAQKAQPAQHQARRTQKAQHTQTARTSSRHTKRVASNRGNGNNGHHYGQISDARYRAHFGNTHTFRMIRPRMIDGYNRFQYSGYWFGYNQPWPSDWAYTDHVYVEYVDNSYYLYNTRRPGIHITLNLF
jgi:hypothetical protein